MTDKSATAAAATVLVVNPRYENLSVEKEVLGAHDVVSGQASDEEGVLSLVRSHRPDAVLAGSTPRFDSAAFRAMAQVGTKILVRYGVGTDNLDLAAARDTGVGVANVRDYCTEEVASHALSLIMACVRDLPGAFNKVSRGDWSVTGLSPLSAIGDTTVGVLGFGAIGRRLVSLLTSVGFDVVVSDPVADAHDISAAKAARVSPEDLFRQSHVLSINAPLTDETRALVRAGPISSMPRGSYLVNTARAEIVDEHALIEALDSGQLRGAAVDVLAQEPPGSANRLLSHPRVLVTPHMAWYSESSVAKLRLSAAEQIREVLAGGEPKYRIV